MRTRRLLPLRGSMLCAYRQLCVSTHGFYRKRQMLQVTDASSCSDLSSRGCQAETISHSLSRGISIAIFMTEEECRRSQMPLFYDWAQKEHHHFREGLPLFTLTAAEGTPILQYKFFKKRTFTAELQKVSLEENKTIRNNQNSFKLLPY